MGRDLIDAVNEACDAGIIVEESGGWFRFNHAIVRRSLLAEWHRSSGCACTNASPNTSKRPRRPTPTAALADLAHHYFESAWAGNAAKAVEYCRRAGDQAMERLAFEGAADLYDRAVQALDIDDTPGREGERAELLLARCEALLAAGDVSSVRRGLQARGVGPRLASPCGMGDLLHRTARRARSSRAARRPSSDLVAAAADQLAELGDGAGEARPTRCGRSCLAASGASPTARPRSTGR